MHAAARLLTLAAVATLGLAPLAARAGAPPLQISVEPLVVQFAVAPGGQASTRVTVRNVGTQKAVVLGSQIDWRTSLDGSVKTERPGTEGGSSLNPYLRLSSTSFTLEPGEAREMTLSLTLPSTFSSMPRDYNGGYFIRATQAGAPIASSFGVGATILCYETRGPPARHLKLTNLHVTESGPRSVQVVARLLNDDRTFVRPQIRMQVAQAGRVVLQRDDSTPAIFGGAPRLYTRTLNDLAPGQYALQLTIDYGASTLIEGTTSFTVR
jgi:hypothetical protein